MNRKLRMGMVGGGKDAFIGAIHRLAFNMDGQVELVAGCLSVNPELAIASGKDLYLQEERIYTDYKEMLAKEVGTVKMGIGEIVHLQEQGWSYIKAGF